MSPLRYPGAKRRLAGYVAALLELNGLKPKLFVEPFAGGSSVALELLAAGRVERIALGEKDSWVASFWKVVFWDTDWLIDRISSIRVTLRQWRHFKRGGFRSDRERAIACLFLNRTSFSGILNDTAGPIGGQKQESKYEIDCRFTRSTLIRRLKLIAAFRDRVEFVHRGNWSDTIAKVRQNSKLEDQDVFYYFDPPFFCKADRLYRHWFERKDHAALRDRLTTLRSPWLVSYDPAVEIIKLYSPQSVGSIRQVDLIYSAAVSEAPTKVREVVITSVSKLPTETRLWRSAREWRPKPARAEKVS